MTNIRPISILMAITTIITVVSTIRTVILILVVIRVHIHKPNRGHDNSTNISDHTDDLAIHISKNHDDNITVSIIMVTRSTRIRILMVRIVEILVFTMVIINIISIRMTVITIIIRVTLTKEMIVVIIRRILIFDKYLTGHGK